MRMWPCVCAVVWLVALIGACYPSPRIEQGCRRGLYLADIYFLPRAHLHHSLFAVCDSQVCSLSSCLTPPRMSLLRANAALATFRFITIRSPIPH